MQSQARFWDKIAPRYAKSPVRDTAAYETTMDRTRSHLSAQDRVLELGCGTGTTALNLAGSAGQITATDLSRGMIDIAEARKREAAAENVDFRQLDLPREAPPETGYDVVLAFNLLHLIAEQTETMRFVHRHLKPDGLFISKTVCLGEGGILMPLLVKAMQLVGKAPFVRFDRISELEQRITDAGFEIVETGNYPAKPPSRFIVARRV